MSLVQKRYIEHMHNETGYRANWFPDRPLKIGDIGKIEDGVFSVYTNLLEQGINARVAETNASLKLDYSFNTKKEFGMNVDSGNINTGGAATLPKGKIKLEFSGDQGLLFNMTTAKAEVIENLAAIEQAVLDKYGRDEWKKDWVVITDLVHTENATIIVSSSRNNQLELDVDGSVEVAKFSLADPSLNISVGKETGSSIKILSAKNITPLFKVRGIKHPFLSKPGFKTREAMPTSASMSFEEQPYDARELAEPTSF